MYKYFIALTFLFALGSHETLAACPNGKECKQVCKPNFSTAKTVKQCYKALMRYSVTPGPTYKSRKHYESLLSRHEACKKRVGNTGLCRQYMGKIDACNEKDTMKARSKCKSKLRNVITYEMCHRH